MFDEASGGGRGYGWRQTAYGFVADPAIALTPGSWFCCPQSRFVLERVLCWSLPGARLARVRAGLCETLIQPGTGRLLSEIDLNRCAPHESIESFTNRAFAHDLGGSTITRVRASEPGQRYSYVHDMPLKQAICDLGGVELGGWLPHVVIGERLSVEVIGACWALFFCGFGYQL